MLVVHKLHLVVSQPSLDMEQFYISELYIAEDTKENRKYL